MALMAHSGRDKASAGLFVPRGQKRFACRVNESDLPHVKTNSLPGICLDKVLCQQHFKFLDPIACQPSFEFEGHGLGIVMNRNSQHQSCSRSMRSAIQFMGLPSLA